MRIDSEFFGKSYLLAEQNVLENKHQILFDIAPDIIHPTEVERIYSDDGLQIMLAQNVRSNRFDFSNEAFMPKNMKLILFNNLVEKNNVVMTRSGANFGQTACFKSDFPIYACADVIIIKPQKVLGGYLSTFFNTRHGRALINRGCYGAAQPHIAPTYLATLPIPRFEKLEKQIDQLIQLSVEEESLVTQHYNQAENLLLSALGLDNWQPPQPLTYEYSSSAVWAAGRLDAEHFQPKYRSLISHLKDRPDGCVRLGDLCPNPVNGVEVREYEDKGVPYLRVGDIHNFTVDENSVKFIAVDAAAREIEKVRLRVGDVLVSRSGSLAVIGVVKADWLHAVISSHLIRVRIEDAEFDPYYVATFLSSLPGKMQIEQQSNGGVQPEINQPALKSIVIPKLDKELQQKIRSSIKFGDATTEKAKRLLEAAKRAVEIAIEENEDAALAFLEEAVEDRVLD